jgi:hypothetical protein
LASQEARVKVPFTWKVTGWFMVGGSAEFPAGETRPLPYQPDRPNKALRLLSTVDAKPYMAMRKWATQFYEVPANV